MEENKTSFFNLLNQKAESIRWNWVFWGTLITIISISGLVVGFSPLNEFIQICLSIFQFSLFFLSMAFLVLLINSNFINEWFQFKIKQTKWITFFITIFLVFIFIILLSILLLSISIYNKNAEQTLAIIKYYLLPFIFSVESVLFIFLLYVNRALNMPRQLKSKLNEIPHELIIKYPTEAIRKAFVVFESILREKIAAPIELSGEKLISEAFNKEKGKLIYSIVDSEQNGVRNLIAGFYAVYRNPIMHHDKEKDIKTAELILLQLDEFMNVVEKSYIRDS